MYAPRIHTDESKSTYKICVKLLPIGGLIALIPFRVLVSSHECR